MENLSIFALGALGLVIHVLFKIQAGKLTDTKFSTKYWFKDNWVEVVLSLMSVVSILLMKNELFEFLGIIPEEDSDRFIKLIAFMSGLYNTELIRKLKKIVAKKSE